MEEKLVMEPMQDGALLKLLRGDGSIKVEDRLYNRLSNEGMPNFLNRVRNEEYAHNARKDREAAQKASEAANSQSSYAVKEHANSGSPSGSGDAGLQTTKDLLQKQGLLLERRVKNLQHQYKQAQSLAAATRIDLRVANRELESVLKFLRQYDKKKEMDADTPEVPHEVGKDIPRQDA